MTCKLVVYRHINRQTDSQSERHRQTVSQRDTERETDEHRQTDRQMNTDRQTDMNIDRKTDIQTDRQILTCPVRDRSCNPSTIEIPWVGSAWAPIFFSWYNAVTGIALVTKAFG